MKMVVVAAGPPLDVYPPRIRTRARPGPGPGPGLRRTALGEACVWAKAKAKLRLLPKIPMVMIKNRRTVVDARLSKFIKALQEEKDYVKIGAVGYCAGGSTAIRLASTEWIQSVVICHPGRFRLPELKAIKVPSAWVCADEDKFFSKSRRMKAEATFRRRKGTEKGIDYEFEEYRGTTHGFACRPDLAVKEMREAYEKAFEQTVRWFSKTLTV
ncbi:hypothetical protein D9615_008880 [Tricholomella constricta]|uniref:Dienelactone hydrolase domain-containing protein n=1 Tax=Tricholomella constricta TaxID=117010 RepID=A0A8H5LYE2_9AGAR|nr:hypothetical protein D9615_008880 [Tricholomella constricta]